MNSMARSECQSFKICLVIVVIQLLGRPEVQEDFRWRIKEFAGAAMVCEENEEVIV